MEEWRSGKTLDPEGGPIKVHDEQYLCPAAFSFQPSETDTLQVRQSTTLSPPAVVVSIWHACEPGTAPSTSTSTDSASKNPHFAHAEMGLRRR
jgi:hypothetical protein